MTQNEITVQTIWLPGGSVQVTCVGYDPAGHLELEAAGEKTDYRQRDDLITLLKTSLHCNHATI